MGVYGGLGKSEAGSSAPVNWAVASLEGWTPFLQHVVTRGEREAARGAWPLMAMAQGMSFYEQRPELMRNVVPRNPVGELEAMPVEAFLAAIEAMTPDEILAYVQGSE